MVIKTFPVVGAKYELILEMFVTSIDLLVAIDNETNLPQVTSTLRLPAERKFATLAVTNESEVQKETDALEYMNRMAGL
jgi:hypothetical protein